MSEFPAVIVSLGPVSAPSGTIVIDYRNGRFWRDGVSLGGRSFQRVSQKFRIIASLLIAGHGGLRYDDLVEALWGDDENGGPANPKQHVNVAVELARGMLEDGLGLHVSCRWGWGYLVTPHTPSEIAAIKADRHERSTRISAGHRKRRTARKGHRPMPLAA